CSSVSRCRRPSRSPWATSTPAASPGSCAACAAYLSRSRRAATRSSGAGTPPASSGGPHELPHLHARVPAVRLENRGPAAAVGWRLGALLWVRHRRLPHGQGPAPLDAPAARRARSTAVRRGRVQAKDGRMRARAAAEVHSDLLKL